MDTYSNKQQQSEIADNESYLQGHETGPQENADAHNMNEEDQNQPDSQAFNTNPVRSKEIIGKENEQTIVQYTDDQTSAIQLSIDDVGQQNEQIAQSQINLINIEASLDIKPTNKSPMQRQQSRVFGQDPKDAAIFEIHKFYSKQHDKLKPGGHFEDFKNIAKMEKGEVMMFLRDFNLQISPSQLNNVLRQISSFQTPLDLEQFKAALPLIGQQHVKAFSSEIKHRLKELKQVLEYPELKVSETLEKLINDIDETPKNGKQLQITHKKPIQQIIQPDQIQNEKQKSHQILTEIQKIMKVKRLLADQEQLSMVKLDLKSKISKQEAQNEGEIKQSEYLLKNMSILDSEMKHPLYQEYYILLNQTLPKYEKIKTEQQMKEFLDKQMQFKGNKFKGVDKDTKMRKLQPKHSRRNIEHIDQIKKQLSLNRLKQQQDVEMDKKQKEMKYQRDREQLSRMHEKMRLERLNLNVNSTEQLKSIVQSKRYEPKQKQAKKQLTEIKTSNKLNPIRQFKKRNAPLESVDAIRSKKILTFEDLNKIDYKQITSKKDAFNPHDFLDLEADDQEDEILGKFEIKFPAKQSKTTKKAQRQLLPVSPKRHIQPEQARNPLQLSRKSSQNEANIKIRNSYVPQDDEIRIKLGKSQESIITENETTLARRKKLNLGSSPTTSNIMGRHQGKYSHQFNSQASLDIVKVVDNVNDHVEPFYDKLPEFRRSNKRNQNILQKRQNNRGSLESIGSKHTAQQNDSEIQTNIRNSNRAVLPSINKNLAKQNMVVSQSHASLQKGIKMDEQYKFNKKAAYDKYIEQQDYKIKRGMKAVQR